MVMEPPPTLLGKVEPAKHRHLDSCLTLINLDPQNPDSFGCSKNGTSNKSKIYPVDMGKPDSRP